jgi:MoxR-like ATPase
VDASVRDYIVALVRATRKDEHVKLGASPRASLSLHRAAQAFAAVRGRTHILPDDVKLLAVPPFSALENQESHVGTRSGGPGLRVFRASSGAGGRQSREQQTN